MRVLEFGAARARSLPKQARVSESSIEECTNRRPRLSFSATCSHGEGFFDVTFVDPYSGISDFSISKSALCRRETNMMAIMKFSISRVKWWYQHLGCTPFNTPWHNYTITEGGSWLTCSIRWMPEGCRHRPELGWIFALN
jgi:hypothetical protein